MIERLKEGGKKKMAKKGNPLEFPTCSTERRRGEEEKRRRKKKKKGKGESHLIR